MTNTEIVATQDDIDWAREAGYSLDTEFVSAWLYDNFFEKTWKNIWTESGPGFARYRIGPMALNHDISIEIRTDWFDTPSGYLAETALYAAALHWLSENDPDSDMLSDAPHAP